MVSDGSMISFATGGILPKEEAPRVTSSRMEQNYRGGHFLLQIREDCLEVR